MTQPTDTTTFHGFGFFRHEKDYLTYHAGDIIFAEGDVGEYMYVVIEGIVNVTLEGHAINFLQPGNLFGEMALMDNRPRSATATAFTDCRLLPLNQHRFTSLIQQEPEFALQVLTIMAERLRRFMDEEVKRQRLEQELRIGRQIQRSLLPRRVPERTGWEFAALYQSAWQIGGDLYDFIHVPDNPDILHLAIADVTGKGIPAALFMAFSRTILRTESRTNSSPAAVLRHANQAIVQDMESRLFLSAFFATLDTHQGRLRYANAGHDWPLWFRATTGQVEPLNVSGLLLGVLPDVTPPEAEIELAGGDVLVLYTDGLTEARDKCGEMFGEERLAAAIKAMAHCSAQEIVNRIAAAVALITGDTPQSDDLTMMVIKRLG
ncbi:MAG: SpoIIE family protein phosphatase [Chloroflexi bacterium]|nr:SpoIIE family protein phosphatase [Chloroflexota bacterium]MBP8058908.1 SpoIIE family protein phosphatase [Chloroflexota bacterium]